MTLPARKLSPRSHPPLALHDRAIDDLRFIRETMERSASFTHVSGIGVVSMGGIALLASLIAAQSPSVMWWIGTWLATAVTSLGLVAIAMTRKSRAAGMPLLSGPGRKFTWNVIPPLLVGGVLTVVFLQGGLTGLLPGAWLLLYGTGVVTGGSYSVRVVPLMGITFMLLGTAALLLPTAGNVFMAAGFGGIHIVFGAIIWRKHGG